MHCNVKLWIHIVLIIVLFTRELSARTTSECMQAGSILFSTVSYTNGLICVGQPCPHWTVDTAFYNGKCIACPTSNPFAIPAAGAGVGSNLYCSGCAAGQQFNAQTFCEYCPNGKYAATPGLACTACPTGKYSFDYYQRGITSCYACVPGTYTASTGSSSCIDCETGKYSGISQRTTQCDICAIGTYASLTGRTACTVCPVYATSPSASTSIDACTCNTGSSGANGGTCTKCVAGTYKQVSGSAECTLCAIGTSNALTGYSTACSPCIAGTYQNMKMSVSCLACPTGKYSSIVGRTNAAQCIDCSRGQYAPVVSSTTCLVCGSNGYTNTNGSSTCTACIPGSTSNPSRTACVACAEGTQGIGGECRECEKGYYSNANTGLQCWRCSNGTYTTTSGSKTCLKCHACPDGYYRSNCSPMSGGGTCTPCPTCANAYVNVGCMNRAGHTDKQGTCRLRQYTSRTPLCDEKKSGFGLGGYSFLRLFGVSQDDSAFQCRRRCDNVQNILSEDVYPGGLRAELIGQFPDITVSGKQAFRPFNGGYCGGPYACDVSNCNIAGSSDDTQDEYQPVNACPVYIDKITVEAFWTAVVVIDQLDTQASVVNAVHAMRGIQCQTCVQCGQGAALVPNWGRGCARDCTQLKCTRGLIFDWTQVVEAEKCKTCGQLDDIRLCLSSEQRAFDMYDVSGRLPKLYMQDCTPKMDPAVLGYEVSYGSCVKCVDFVQTCASESNMYYKTCENNGAGVVPVCALCSASSGRAVTSSTYFDGQTLQKLYCQQKRCAVSSSLSFTGVNRASKPHSVCHKQCKRKVCDGDASQVRLPCVLPHEERCKDAISMDNFITDTSYSARQYAPAHVNILEPATDALHLFASFENTLVDTQAYQMSMRGQCVWNADFIVDNNMNPGGVSTTFQKACRPWLRDARAIYPLMPLQNTVTLDDVEDTVFPRRVLLNTSAQAVTYASDTVDRPANVFAGDIYLELNLSNTNNATLAVFVPDDRNITEATWVPRWRVSVHAQQIAGDETSLFMSTPNDGMCPTCFLLRHVAEGTFLASTS